MFIFVALAMRKKFKIGFLLAFVFLKASSQTGWQLQNAPPLGTGLRDIYFMDNEIGWTWGDFAHVFGTLDGGKSWDQINVPKKYIINSDFFWLDKNTAWMVAAGDLAIPAPGGTIFKTTDRGQTWSTLSSVLPSTPQITFEDIFFIDSKRGWICANSNENDPSLKALILRTLDGGITWVEQRLPVRFLTDITFKDANIGYAVGGDYPHEGFVFGTSDGGANWSILHHTTTGFLYSVSEDKSHIWAAGAYGTIVHSSNDGLDWNYWQGNTPEFFRKIQFIDENEGWVKGQDGSLMHSTDGGLNWELQGFQPMSLNFNMTSPSEGWTVGANSNILHTIDSAKTWTKQLTETITYPKDIKFVNKNNGWIVGEGGNIVNTIDGGINWKGQNSTTIAGLNCVVFINDSTGWIAGDDGTILSTADAGKNWLRSNTNTSNNIKNIMFLNSEIGWFSGEGGLIKNTLDGGITWNEQITNTTETIFDVVFTDSMNGWAAAGNLISLLYTKNGGVSWNTKLVLDTNGNKLTFTKLFFSDSNNGWAIGIAKGTFESSYSDTGVLYNTVDGGNTWDLVLPSITVPFAPVFYDLFFLNNDVGWVVGNLHHSGGGEPIGTIYRTLDGGKSWILQEDSVPSAPIMSIIFADSVGWAVAKGNQHVKDEVIGLILKTDDFGGKGSQLIFFNQIGEKQVGDEPFLLSAISTAGLSITFTSSDSLVATISDRLVTIKGPGQTEITAAQPGNDSYLPASVKQILVVNEVTGMEDYQAAIFFYPNPSTGFFYMNLSDGCFNGTYNVIDSNGKQLIDGKCELANEHLAFDLRSLKAGNYVIQIKACSQTFSFRALITK